VKKIEGNLVRNCNFRTNSCKFSTKTYECKFYFAKWEIISVKLFLKKIVWQKYL